MRGCAEAWITGIGLVSSLGEGAEAHWQRLGSHAGSGAVVDESRYPPYAVHPLAEVDFSRQIPRTIDQRQMGRWQRIGVHAAGLALADAGVSGRRALLERIDLAIAAGNGERDLQLDARILHARHGSHARRPDGRLNELLMTGLRPTLYLGQLSNLLAGNISIVHKATGSSRTFKGEEAAGVAALEDAVSRLRAGESELVLVGAALNAEREDLLLNLELGGALLQGGYRPVWGRSGLGGGMVPGSIGAFLVLETPACAAARGARPFASLAAVVADQSPHDPGERAASALRMMERLQPLLSRGGRLGILSGASGVEPATNEERAFLRDAALRAEQGERAPAYGSMLGHGIEAHFITGVALAALALSKRSFYPSFDATEGEARPACGQVLVTGFGHCSGEALGLVQAVAEGGRG